MFGMFTFGNFGLDQSHMNVSKTGESTQTTCSETPPVKCGFSTFQQTFILDAKMSRGFALKMGYCIFPLNIHEEFLAS
jgi:hypothetical protein